MANMTGGIGNDTLFGGLGDDLLNGGAGNDVYRYDLGSGSDTISDATGATGGADRLVLTDTRHLIESFNVQRSGTNNANLVFDFGGAGKVTVLNQFAGAAVENVSWTFNGIMLDFTVQSGVTGNTGNDLIVGVGTAETLVGNAGNDMIFGNGGNDSLAGGDGNDTLFGGADNDTLAGGAGNDVYRYDLGTGSDVVTDTGGTDTVQFADPQYLFGAFDVYRTGTNNANLVFDFGAAGKLTLQDEFGAGGAIAVETMGSVDGWGPFNIRANTVGTSVNDLLVGSASAETISGGGGDDLIFGGGGNDTIYGNAGENELHGGAGNDSLVAGADGGGFYGGAGNDTLVGGSGWDEAYYDDETGGVFANLSGDVQAWNNRLLANNTVLTASGGVDTLISIDSFTGSAYADIVEIGRSDASLSISLGKGNDTLVGGLAESGDGLWCSVGYWDDPAGVIVNLSNRALTATLDGVTYNVGRSSARDGWGNTDTFVSNGGYFSIGGSDYGDAIRGRDNISRSDWFNTSGGNDTIDGGIGNDGMAFHDDDGEHGVVVNLSSVAWSGTFNGAALTVAAGKAYDNWGATDTLVSIEMAEGSSQGDLILGSAGDNSWLNGNEGNDTINGGAGNDGIAGNLGNDVLTGGAGQDNFIFEAPLNAASNIDTIIDFNAIDDNIILDSGVFGMSHGPLAGSAFYAAAGATRAHLATDRVIYNTTTGALYFDADGTGTGSAAVQFAVLSSKPTISNFDFWVN